MSFDIRYVAGTSADGEPIYQGFAPLNALAVEGRSRFVSPYSRADREEEPDSVFQFYASGERVPSCRGFEQQAQLSPISVSMQSIIVAIDTSEWERAGNHLEPLGEAGIFTVYDDMDVTVLDDRMGLVLYAMRDIGSEPDCDIPITFIINPSLPVVAHIILSLRALRQMPPQPLLFILDSVLGGTDSASYDENEDKAIRIFDMIYANLLNNSSSPLGSQKNNVQARLLENGDDSITEAIFIASALRAFDSAYIAEICGSEEDYDMETLNYLYSLVWNSLDKQLNIRLQSGERLQRRDIDAALIEASSHFKNSNE